MKTEEETSILEASQQALIIRVGDFLAPGYSANVTKHVGDSVSDRPELTVTTDVMVSETNISEFIHASLDLLIDGEKGIWYLTKDGFFLPVIFL